MTKKIFSLILFTLCVTLIGSNFIGKLESTESTNKSAEQIIAPLFANERSPISINGNASLTPENGVTAGNGTFENPYIIENWTITSSGVNGIYIYGITAHLIIRNCTIINGLGIYLHMVNNLIMTQNLIKNNTNCISMSGGVNCTFMKNNFTDNNYGVNIYYSQDILFSNNTITKIYQNGMECRNCSSVTISFNRIQDGSEGIILKDSSNLSIFSNVFRKNYYGLRIDGGCSNTTIWSNIFYDNTMKNIYFLLDNPNTTTFYNGSGNYYSNYKSEYPDALNDGVTWNIPYEFNTNSSYDDLYPLVVPGEFLAFQPNISIKINNNSCFTSKNYISGGIGSETNPYRIEHLSIYTEFLNGIEILNTDAYVEIINCTIGETGAYAFYIENASHISLINCTIMNMSLGVFLNASETINFMNNSIDLQWKGRFSIQNSLKITLTNNTLKNEYVGLSISDSVGITIIGTNMDSKSDIMTISRTSSVIFRNNLFGGSDFVLSDTNNTIFTNNCINVSIFDIQETRNNSIDTSNLLNGKIIYYFEDQEGLNLHDLHGPIILMNCNDSNIQNCEISEIGNPISLIRSNNITVSHNLLNLGNLGIFCYFSTNIWMENNVISSFENGIAVQDSSNLSINKNRFYSNEMGALLWSSINNTVFGNTFQFNHYGFGLVNSTYTNVSYNNFTSNEMYSIALMDTSHTMIWANNFVNTTTNHTNDENTVVDTLWYYNQMGNFYDDYLSLHPYADVNGSYWCTPYLIQNVQNKYVGVDLFPLISHVIIENPPKPTFVPAMPFLNPIQLLSTSENITKLSWNQVEGASMYKIFRSDAVITSITNLQPLVITTTTSFADILPQYGTFYYVILATNSSGDSSFSNCESISFVFNSTTTSSNLTNSSTPSGSSSNSQTIPTNNKIGGYPMTYLTLSVLFSCGGIIWLHTKMKNQINNKR